MDAEQTCEQGGTAALSGSEGLQTGSLLPDNTPFIATTFHFRDWALEPQKNDAAIFV